MDLYGQTDKSIPQKIVIHLTEMFLLWLSYWILFQNGGQWVEHHLSIPNTADATHRRLLLFSFNLIIFFRLAYMMFFLLKRKIPWEESISVPFAFGLYYVGYSLFVLPVAQSIDFWDGLAVILFFIGCILNSGGEILRDQWKRKPENKGKLYTQGFFKYSRHINYFGDLLWVTAYAILTKNAWAITVPVFLFCFFAFYNAPKLDHYLKQKYGVAYEEYARKVNMLIPFIF